MVGKLFEFIWRVNIEEILGFDRVQPRWLYADFIVFNPIPTYYPVIFLLKLEVFSVLEPRITLVTSAAEFKMKFCEISKSKLLGN